jgi:hypothetical protein
VVKSLSRGKAMKKSITEKDLKRIEAYMKPLQQAERRAHALASSLPKASLYVAICGTDVAFDHLPIANGLGFIRKVTNPPGIVHVCRAADLDRTDYLTVARYSSSVRAELGVGLVGREDMDFFLDTAYHTAALLKLRNHANLFCPCFATASWDVISGISNNRVTFGVLDDAPRRIRGTDLEKISAQDVEWTSQVWETALSLRDFDSSRRFGLAFNIAYTWNQTSDLRIALANVWCGIEALFGDKSDRPVTRSMVERITGWIPSLSFDEVQDSYNHRCDAVHGRWVEQEILDSVYKADSILREALVTCIDKNSVPLPDWR